MYNESVIKLSKIKNLLNEEQIQNLEQYLRNSKNENLQIPLSNWVESNIKPDIENENAVKIFGILYDKNREESLQMLLLKNS